ncbi:hypothetical protein JW711_05895 [Candidatus Woesearchaeota archaeon]|nr:hypothetical protein [Candidatus Woesearchaeota archaeon]
MMAKDDCGQEDSLGGVKKDVLGLKSRLEAVEKELSKVEDLEKSLAYQEIVLARKVSDIHRFEERLEGFVKHDHIKGMRKDLLKVSKHEDLLFENAQYIKEALRELQKAKDAQKSDRERHNKKVDTHKQENEENFARLRKMIEVMERMRRKRRKQILGALQGMKREYDSRLERLEDQNRQVLAELKKISKQ